MHKTFRLTIGGVKIDQLPKLFSNNTNFGQAREQEDFKNHQAITFLHELTFYAALDFLYGLLDTHIARKDILSVHELTFYASQYITFICCLMLTFATRIFYPFMN